MSARRILRAVARTRETGWLFTAAVAVPYLAYLIWMHAHHEMWRDEIHAWTLSRLAQGFGELVTGDRIYEGHPPLWFWYLHVWSWLTWAPWGIQAATIAAAIAAAVLLLRYAPFPRYLKVLLLCSYLLGYEYTVICRNYVLGWAALCLFCALYHPLRARRLALAAALSAMALSSVMGLAMALALLLFLVLDGVRFERGGSGLVLDVSAGLAGALAIAAGALAFCVYTLQAPDPNMFDPGWRLEALAVKNLPRLLMRLCAGYFPLKPFSRDFFDFSTAQWNHAPPWVGYVGAATLVLCLVSLARSWRLLVAYLAGVLLLQFVMQARYEGNIRHWGHIFVLYVGACWLLRRAVPARRHLLSLVLLVAMAGFQLRSFVAAAIWDTRAPFSAGKATAAFIQKHHLQDLPIVGGPSWMIITVTGYLERPFVNAENEEVSDTVVFHARRRKFPNAPALARAILDKAVEVSRERGSPVLVIATVRLPPPPEGVTAGAVYTSVRGAVTDEVFYVYEVTAQPSPP